MATRPFSDFLLDLRKGLASQELAERLQEVVHAVEEVGKQGMLTFTLKIKPNKGGTVLVEDHIKATLPERENGTSLFFVTPESNLSRHDERQGNMFETIVAIKKD